MKKRAVHLGAHGCSFLAQAAVDLLLLSMVSKYAADAEFVAVQLVLSYSVVCAVIYGLGSPFAITYYTSRKVCSQKYVVDCANNTLFISFGATVLYLSLVFLGLISADSFGYFLSVSALAAAIGIRQIVLSRYLGQKKLVASSLTRVLGRVTSFLFVFLYFIWLSLTEEAETPGPVLLNALFIAGCLVEIVVHLFVLGGKYSFNFRLRKRYYYLGLKGLIGNLLGAAVQTLPFAGVALVGMAPSDTKGLITVLTIGRYYSLIFGPLLQLVLPYIGGLSRNDRRLKKIAFFGLIASVIAGIGVGSLLSISATLVIDTLFPAYDESIALLEIYSYVAAPILTTGFCGAFLSSLGRVNAVLRLSFIYLLVMTMPCIVYPFFYNEHFSAETAIHLLLLSNTVMAALYLGKTILVVIKRGNDAKVLTS